MQDLYRSAWWADFVKKHQEVHGKFFFDKLTWDEYLEYFFKKLEFAELEEHKSFPTKAMQKDLLDDLNRMYDRQVENKIRVVQRNKYHYQYLDGEKRQLTLEQERFNKKMDALENVPFNLCHLREKHKIAFVNKELGLNEFDLWDKAMFLVKMREELKDIPVVKRPPKKPKLPVKTPQSAEYKGECQYCGCWHNIRIKTGLIADHGYEISAGNGWYYGERTGNCKGINQLPYQESKDWLEERYVWEFKRFLKIRKNRGEYYQKFKRNHIWELKWLRKRIKGWDDRIKDLRKIEYADENNV